jgi:hypothetical protein
MMNESATILLFFTGMVAFVPEQPKSNTIEAFLVNVQGHHQYLSIPWDRLENERECRGICSKEDGELCVCDLRKEGEVDADSITEIVIPTNAGNRFLPDAPPRALTPHNAGDIGWLVNMSYVKPRASKIDPARLTGNVGAQMKFGWTDAATCRFEEAECEVGENKYRRVFKVEFDDWIDPFDESQPVAELVVFEAKVSVPVLKIAFKKHNVWQSQEIKLKCDSQSCPIFISNSMASDDDSKALCKKCEGDSGISDHFRSFGRLAGSDNGLPIHRKCEDDDYENLPEGVPALCGPGNRFGPRTLGDRIICPPAVLSN